jgi:hypothetical protein
MGYCEHSNETSGPIKDGEYFYQLSDCDLKKGLCSMKLINRNECTVGYIFMKHPVDNHIWRHPMSVCKLSAHNRSHDRYGQLLRDSCISSY